MEDEIVHAIIMHAVDDLDIVMCGPVESRPPFGDDDPTTFACVVMVHNQEDGPTGYSIHEAVVWPNVVGTVDAGWTVDLNCFTDEDCHAGLDFDTAVDRFKEKTA